MRKYLVILAIGAMIALTACGSGSTTNEANDSTAVDTTNIVIDTTNAVADTAVLK